jgi:hypothetical protein
MSSKLIREFVSITGEFFEDMKLGSVFDMMSLQEICLKRKCGEARWSKAVPLTSVSKQRFCGCPLAGIVGSNLAVGIDISCE